MIFEQIIVLLSCYILFLLMYFIGKLLFLKSTNGIGYIFSGYGFLYILFLLSGFINSNLLYYVCPLFFVGLFSYRYNKLSKSLLKHDLQNFLSAQIIISPFLIYTFFLNNLNWDDYATWLPNSYYIFEHGHLPKNNIKSIDSAHPAYPYAFPLLIGLINKINGHFYENVAPILNVIFLSFILIMAIPNKTIKFSQVFFRQIYSIPILFLAVLIMNTKGVFGAGPDLVICLISCFYVFYDFKNYNIENTKKISVNYEEILFKCLIGISLIGTKQVGLYIFFIISIASLLAKFIVNHNNRIDMNNILKSFFNFLIPIFFCCVINYLWNFYAELEGLRLSFGSFSLEHIRLHDLENVLWSVWSSTMEKPYVLIALFVNLYFFIRYKNNHLLIQYFVITSFITVIFIVCFLLLAYLTVFGEFEGNRAASFERYIAPAGFINLISMLFVINKKEFNINIISLKTYMYPLIIALVYIGISISEKKRIIRSSSINFPELIDYFQINFKPKSSINIFDFYSLGYTGHILTFKLYGQFDINRYDPLNYNLEDHNIDKYINERINIFFGKFNDDKINSIINKLKLKKSNIINSKELNIWILKVKR